MKSGFLLLFACILTITGMYAQSPSKPRHELFTPKDHGGRGSGTFNYTLTVLNEAYSDLIDPISINQGEIWDDPVYVFPVDFPFDLNGNIITFLEFDGVGAFLRSETAESDIETYIFPFETDLIDRGSGGATSLSPISYKVEGGQGSRILKLEMKNAGSFAEFFQLGTTDMYINFQMWLYEGTNVIEFRFGENLITDPNFFYGFGGVYVGLSDYNFVDDIVINPHFLGGPASAPQLSVSDITLEGTPDDGTVYRLSPNLPVDVTVTGVNSTSICDPNGSATADVSGGSTPYSYLWNNAGTTPTITNLEAGTYSVTVTDASGSSVIGSVTITNVDPINPNVSTTDETGADENDGTATSSAFGGTPPYSFEWSNGETTQTITGLAPGDYTVTVTDSEDCTGTQTVTINAFECSGLEIVFTQVNPACHGLCDGWLLIDDVINGTAPYTYIWSNGSVSNPIEDLCAGDYFVTIIDADGCVVQESFVLIEPPALETNAQATAETSEDANDGTAWAAPTGGTPPYTYLWSNSSTDSLITNLSPGAYGVTVTDQQGCIDSQNVIIDTFLCSGIVISTYTDISCFGVCNGLADVEVVGGNEPYSYQWSNGDTTRTSANLCPGIYYVTVTEAGGNCPTIDSFNIIEPPALEVVVDNVIHYNNLLAGIISITVSGGTPPYISYNWTGPNGYTSDMEDISGLLPGFYTSTILDSRGCFITTDSIEIRDETVSTSHLVNIDIRIYPNPAEDRIILDLEDVNGFQIELISMDGRRIKSWEAQRILLISDIPAGVYILQGTSEKNIFKKQIMIVR